MIEFLKTRKVKDPCRGTVESAGVDFFIPDDIGWESKTLRAGEDILIPSGLYPKIEKGWALVGDNKSGVATKFGLILGAKVIDSDYQGEMHIHLINVKSSDTTIKAGQKIAQFLLIPISLAQPLVKYDVSDEVMNFGIDSFKEILESFYSRESTRGAGGFGSTGIE